MSSVYIIDHSNFAYKFRSVHTWSRVDINGVSVDTSVVNGYVRALKSNPSDDILIALDGVPEMFNGILPGYKGQRSHEKEDTTLSVPYKEVVQFLTTVGSVIGKRVRVVAAPLQEADQVISSVVHLVTNNLPSSWKFISRLNSKQLYEDRILSRLNSSDLEVDPLSLEGIDSIVVGTTDADMAQLQRFDGVFIDTSTSGKAITSSRTADSVMGVSPAAIPIYKAIYGDVSDNIPPIKLSYKKDLVLSMIEYYIKKHKDPAQFYQDVFGPSDEFLVKMVRKDSTAFHKNWQVCFLKFYSVPFVLKYTDFSIEDFIERYNIRI